MTEGSGEVTDKQYSILSAVLAVDILAYTVTICFGLYNIWAFLIKQSKYKVYFLFMFYLFAMAVLISRLVFSINFFIFDINKGYHSSDITPFLLGDQADFFATYCKACLGFFQLASILELVFRLRQNINKMKIQQIQAEKRQSRRSVQNTEQTLRGTDDSELFLAGA